MTLRPDSCSRCSDILARSLDRRRFLHVTAAGLAGAVLAPWPAFAQQKPYEAMVLACIDPRFQVPVARYTEAQKLQGKFSQFNVAGAAIGVVAPMFKDWHKTFWDNLGASIEFHGIKRVIAIDHRDCGAARLAYGDAAVATPAAETETHRQALAEFRRQMKERHPAMSAETGLMALDGKLEILG